MEKIFNVGQGFEVPDGTVVSSVLDPRLANLEGSAWVDEVSLAVGVIPAGVTSKIHVHPLVVQVTWVLSGQLCVKMKDSKSEEPYTLDLTKEQAALTQAGTFFQLINKWKEPARVLYIVAPAFLFEADAKGVKYNDALVLDETWEHLEKMNWKIPQLQEIEVFKRERESTLKRLKATLK